MTTTPHDPAAVQALIDAIDKAKAAERSTYTPEHERLYHDIVYAREALRPKPEMEKVLTEEMLKNIRETLVKWGITNIDVGYVLDELVTLTMRPVQKQKWNMPEWGDLPRPLRHSGCFELGEYDEVSKSFYNTFRAKILSLNEETP